MAETNLKTVNYLNVTLILSDGSFKFYHNPDDTIQYIDKESNNPASVIKQLQCPLKNGFQTTLPMKKYLKNQQFIIKIH